MDWRIKGAIQKALGYVPMGDRIHHALQRRAGLAGFIRECDLKVEDWRIAMGYFRKNPEQPYCQAVVAPKVGKLRKHFYEQLRATG